MGVTCSTMRVVATTSDPAPDVRVEDVDVTTPPRVPPEDVYPRQTLVNCFMVRDDVSQPALHLACAWKRTVHRRIRASGHAFHLLTYLATACKYEMKDYLIPWDLTSFVEHEPVLLWALEFRLHRVTRYDRVMEQLDGACLTDEVWHRVKRMLVASEDAYPDDDEAVHAIVSEARRHETPRTRGRKRRR